MRVVLSCVLILSLLFIVACNRRIAIIKPNEAKVIISDRVNDVLSDKTMQDVIDKAPEGERPALIREWIAAKERIIQSILKSEDDRNTKGLSLADMLRTALTGFLAYKVAK